MVRVLILLVMFSYYGFAQDFSASAGVDSGKYQVGDYITYKIKLTHPKEYKYRIWELQKGLGGLELISTSSPVQAEENGKNKVELIYTLAGYDSGYKTIQGGDILFINNAKQDTQRVTVDSVLVFITTVQVDTAAEIKDINAPRTIPMSFAEIMMWAGIVLLILVIAYFLYRYFSRREVKEVKPVEPEIPVDERALQKLAELENKKLWQNAFIKEYHTEITEIIRGYFEEKLKIPALEMTTGEIYSSLSSGLKDQRIPKVTEEFLNNADLVKFAKFVPLAGINEEMMNQARRIVELCKTEKEGPHTKKDSGNA